MQKYIYVCLCISFCVCVYMYVYICIYTYVKGATPPPLAASGGVRSRTSRASRVPAPVRYSMSVCHTLSAPQAADELNISCGGTKHVLHRTHGTPWRILARSWSLRQFCGFPAISSRASNTAVDPDLLKGHATRQSARHCGTRQDGEDTDWPVTSIHQERLPSVPLL